MVRASNVKLSSYNLFSYYFSVVAISCKELIDS